jgi:glutamate formiminotransferase / 5-formyltetrahydrofolate cyclo-ligase
LLYCRHQKELLKGERSRHQKSERKKIMTEKKAIVECIPNFSEGRKPEVIEKIAEAFRSTAGCTLLNHSSDRDHNRTVFTALGSLSAMKESILKAVEVAVKEIDMENHSGEHPRIGACDVVPFVPIVNCTMDECRELARSTAGAINEKFGIPIYLYEASALRPERVNLADIRKGEYEGLKKEITLEERHPDIGKPEMHPTAGATVVGARKPLIAYNVNLNTPDLKIAKEIAKRMRAKTGGLTYVKALGVMLKERNIAQVSMNLTDFSKSAIYTVFEMVKMEARRYGVTTLGTEIVGLVPMEALVEAARYYLQIEGFVPSQVLESHLLDL